MANIKSQKKRIITSEKARIRNVSYRSKLRTAIKNVRVACEAGKVEDAKKALLKAYSVIDRSVSKGIQTKFTAARQKSNLTNLLNNLEAKLETK